MNKVLIPESLRVRRTVQDEINEPRRSVSLAALMQLESATRACGKLLCQFVMLLLGVPNVSRAER